VSVARRALGNAGEDAAAAWYEANGYEVVARNWRCREGELDLVARRNRTIVFCEVKTRSTDAFGSPAEAVNYVKRQRVRVLAGKWLEDFPVRVREIRFDVVSVIGDTVEVIEGAF
jgi:putative endonuclease